MNNDLYNNIMNDLAKVFMKHLYESCVIDVKEINDFANKCVEYGRKHRIPERIGSRDIYADKSRTLNEVIARINRDYTMEPWRRLSHEGTEITEGKSINSLPVKMTAAILTRRSDMNAIIKEMNKSGYTQTFPEYELAQEPEGMIVLFFMPVEENPINNIDTDNPEYLYYAEPKDSYGHSSKIHYHGRFVCGIWPLLESNPENVKTYISAHTDDDKTKWTLCKIKINPELLNTYTFYEDEEIGYYYTKNIIDPRFITSVEDIE